MSEQPLDRSQLPIEERRALGKSQRKQVSRKSHAGWTPAPNRKDPIKLLQAQDKGRIQDLLPIKYGRMLASPFAFYRGSAVVMASDLATTPITGQAIILCGDAHLSNFGIFATPERNLVFDINDFDEVYPGPWEWDIKRLAASAVLAGRENGFIEKECQGLAMIAVRSYREAMQRFSEAAILDVWYFHVGTDSVLKVFTKYAAASAGQAKKSVGKAEASTSEKTMQKLSELVDGKRQFVNKPPLVQRLSELLTEEQKEKITRQGLEGDWSAYIKSLPQERRLLLERFRVTDAALRVGGVGSVGTRCSILMLEGDADHDALILQQKEAGPSALAAYLPKKRFVSQAERIVIGQRAMQAASDIFLGWNRIKLTGTPSYYRQLKDKKGSIEMQKLDVDGMGAYLGVCGLCLARAHARTGDSAWISGYLGGGTAFDEAIGDFAVAYADQVEQDYQLLVEAVNSGRIQAQTGI
jgi:uncharacterized protein (DUF2252 family)